MTIGSTLSNLIRENVVVCFIDARSGDLTDRGSLRLNNGVPSSGCRWSGRALTFPANTDEVTVADSASLAVTNMSIVMLGRFQSQITTEYLVSKRSGGNTHFQFSLYAANLGFYDGVNARNVTADVRGKRGVGVTCQSGGTPIGYVDGISVGNFSGVSTITADAVALEIGNWADVARCLSPLEAVVMVNRVLTATEMAAVHSDLVNMRWPSRYVSLAKRVQGSAIGEPTLKAGYTLKPVGASVPSHNGAFTGTISGQASSRESILGPALELGRVTGAVDLGIGNATINPTTDSHWVEVWARPLDVAMSDAVSPIIGKGNVGNNAYYRNGGVMHVAAEFRLTWFEGGAAVQLSGPAPRNKLTHVLYQIDHTAHQSSLWVDGVLYGPTVYVGAWSAAQATNWVVGKFGDTNAGSDESFGGLVCNPRIGLGVLTAAQVQARYLEGARAIQFKTGYGFQVSPVREGGVLGQQIGGTLSPFRAGDTTGRWLIETDTIEGKSCKVLTCSTAGKLYLSTAGMADATPTEAAFGTYDLYARKADASVFDMNLIATVSTGITTGYGFKWAADESVVVYEYGVGNVVAGGSASHSVWHRFRLTRSITGLFTAYIDGVSFGTGTDITTLTSGYMVFDMDAGDKLSLSDMQESHCLIKHLGVVAATEGP